MNAPKIQISFEYEATSDGMDKAVALLKYADTLTPAQAPPPAQPPKQGKAAPAPAPKGKTAAPAASKANSKAKPKEPEQSDIMDFTGDDDEEEDQTGGLGLGDDDAEEAFDGTPEEAKEEALAKLRVMLGSGLKSHVKEVQQIMKVAKFHDVPAEQGFEFLAAVKKVEAKIAKN